MSARTHKPKLPGPHGPPRPEVLHDEHVCDDALVIAEREAAEGREHGAA